MSFSDAIKAAKALAPETGYNLIGQDDFEPVGEDLYLISHHATKDAALEAQKARAAKIAADPDAREITYILGSQPDS